MSSGDLFAFKDRAIAERLKKLGQQPIVLPKGNVLPTLPQPQFTAFYQAITQTEITGSTGEGADITIGTGKVKRYKRTRDEQDITKMGVLDTDPIDVFNIYGSIDSGTWILIGQDAFGDFWVAERIAAFTIVSGQQVGALLTSDTTNGLDNLTLLVGSANLPDEITANNDFSFEADDGALTYAFLDNTNTWRMFQVKCPA